MLSRLVSRRPWLFTLGAEALVWFGAAIGFLWVYASFPGHTPAAAWHHLGLLSATLTVFVVVRVALWRWVPIEGLARWLGSFLGALLLLLLLTYYVLVIGGMHSWGRVVSWPLISTYAVQWQPLALSQGIAPGLVVAGVIIALVCITSVIALGPARKDWVATLATQDSRIGRLLVLGGFSIGCIYLLAHSVSPTEALVAREPVSLTLFHDQQAGRSIQGHRLVESGILDHRAELERARYVPSSSAQRRNVILIVGDALRADHMAIYGYPRPTTPYLSELKSKGQLQQVQRAWSVCAESSCGLMALVKSQYVHELGTKSMTLLDVLKRHGYETHLILSGDHTNFYGLKEDYGPVDHYFDGFQSGSRYMNDDRLVIDKVATLPSWAGRPTFFQFHLMSSHALGTRNTPPVFLPSESYSPLVVRGVTNAQPKPELTNFYDNGVIGFDDTVRRLLQLLELKGYLRDAIVVITGDHGEMLGEDGSFGHTRGLHEAVLNVPIAFVEFPHPVDQTRPLAPMGSQVDVAPTLMDMLGMPSPSHWSGRSLLQEPEPRVIYVKQAPFVGLIDVSPTGTTWKYWVNVSTREARAHTVPGDPMINELQRVEPGRHGKWSLDLMHSVNEGGLSQ